MKPLFRAPMGTKICMENMGHPEYNRQSLCVTSTVMPTQKLEYSETVDAGSTWPKSREPQTPNLPLDALHRRRPSTRPSLFPVFAHNSQNTSQRYLLFRFCFKLP